MVLSNDIELNGVSYNVVPGAYKKGLRKAQSGEQAAGAAHRARRSSGPSTRGLLQATAEDEERGWEGITVGPVFDGEGVEPFPNSTSFADATTDVPSATVRAYGVGGRHRMPMSGSAGASTRAVLLTNGTWSAFTVATDLGVGLRHLGAGLLPRRPADHARSAGRTSANTTRSTGSVTVWRTGQKAVKGVAYAGQMQ